MRAALLFLAVLCSAFAFGEDKADLAVVHKIRDQAFNHSEIMETLFYLSDANGPRVTNSNGFKSAAAWAVKRLESFGLVNVKEEPWGAFGRSWNFTHYEGHMIEPQYSPLIGFPLAWTPGTNGVVRGDAMLAVLATPADLDKYKGQLRGKMVLTMAPKEVEMSTTAWAHRLTDEEIESRGRFGFAGPGGRGGRGGRGNAPQDPAAARRFRERMMQFLIDEKPAVVVQYNATQEFGDVFGTSFGSYKAGDPIPPPAVVIATEQYNRIARLVEHKMPVKLEFDIRATIGTHEEQSFNIVGEIPGTGPHKDQIVMLGGHFDSWQGGTGATDNGTGSSVAMEAVRILKAINTPMDRTVRIALWSGEEQGLLGSIAYVKNHFADRADMKLKPEYAKLSAYYNDDSGSGKFRGIGTQGNDAVAPIFQAWIEPFKDLGAAAVTGQSQAPNRPPAGTDHTSFDYAGLPGFGFMQDPLEYGTRTHHSNMDLYDRVQKGDVMQAAAIEAAFVYHTAVRAEMMPRLPEPKPRAWDQR
jgi:carboxypeptidase Q